MRNIETIEFLNKIAKKQFPNVHLCFGPDLTSTGKRDKDIFSTCVSIASLLRIHKVELSHNSFDESKIEKILRIRLKNAYRNIIDFAQEELEKL